MKESPKYAVLAFWFDTNSDGVPLAIIFPSDRTIATSTQDNKGKVSKEDMRSVQCAISWRSIEGLEILVGLYNGSLIRIIAQESDDESLLRLDLIELHVFSEMF